MSRNNTRTYDAALLLKDIGTAISADAPAQVAAADKILDLGTGYFDGVVQVDVTAIDTVTGDELYLLKAQFSSSSSFASGIVTGSALVLGGATGTGNSAVTGTGRWELYVCNEVGGTLYRYMRMYTDVAGTTPSITYSARLYRDN